MDNAVPNDDADLAADPDAARRRTHDTIDRLIDRLLAHDMDGFADQWAPSGVMEFPFAPPGWPAPHGREQVRSHLSGYTSMVDIREVAHQVRHDTADPATVIVEWGVDGIARATARRYRMDYVAVVTVGPEGIERYRDYWNSLALGYLTGAVDSMVAAYEQAEKLGT